MTEAVFSAPWLKAFYRELNQFTAHTQSPVLVHGQQRRGLLSVANQWAAFRLCEQPVGDQACEHCAACHMRQGGNHPDLQVLCPQSVSEEMGFPLELKTGTKPSQEIRVDDVRQLQSFLHTASSRGHERIVLVYPFDALNLNAANALLKILEEPGEGLRFVLIGHKPEHLLPTIRSRCQSLAATEPDYKEAVTWLKGLSVAEPEVAFSLAMNDPFDALDLSNNQTDQLGLRKKWVDWLVSPEQQNQLPAGLEKIGFPVAVELAQRVCADLSAVCQGGTVEVFPWLAPRVLWARRISLQSLSRVFALLTRQSAIAEHPLNPRLALEFVAQEWHNQLVKTQS